MCMLETHCISEKEIHIADYIPYDTVRPKSKHETRNYGGVSVLIKSSISQGITVVEKCADYI